MDKKNTRYKSKEDYLKAAALFESNLVIEISDKRKEFIKNFKPEYMIFYDKFLDAKCCGFKSEWIDNGQDRYQTGTLEDFMKEFIKLPEDVIRQTWNEIEKFNDGQMETICFPVEKMKEIINKLKKSKSTEVQK